MPYTHTTLAQLRTLLAARLSDRSQVFWPTEELDEYLLEALRLFGSLTGFWRDQASFVTTAGVAFYDITSINAAFTSLLGYSLTDQSLLTTIQNHFLEPPSDDSWAGTDQFDLQDVQDALQEQRNKFLAATGVRVTPFSQATVTGDREDLPDTVIDIRRLVWQRLSDSQRSHLWREDEWNMTAFDQTWLTPVDPPIAYSTSATPPITVQLLPPASVAGNLELITVDSGADLDLEVGVPLGIPDDLCWAIKWGAMAELMAKSGQARDLRAQHCKKRYEAGIAIARAYPQIIQARIGSTPVLVDSINNLDAFKVDWQNEAPGTPDIVAVAGHNLVALSPVPDGVHTITLDVVRKTDIPTGGDDFVEIGREDLDGILNYAQHIATFKIGGLEFDLTQWQASDFMQEAVLRNQLMRAETAGSLSNMFAISRRESEDRPRRMSVGKS
jgi:hypothetical protein